MRSSFVWLGVAGGNARHGFIFPRSAFELLFLIVGLRLKPFQGVLALLLGRIAEGPIDGLGQIVIINAAELRALPPGCCGLVIELTGLFVLVAALKLEDHVHDVCQIDSVLPSGMILGVALPLDQVFGLALHLPLADERLDSEVLLFSQLLGLMYSWLWHYIILRLARICISIHFDHFASSPTFTMSANSGLREAPPMRRPSIDWILR